MIIKHLVCANCRGKVWREETSQDESDILGFAAAMLQNEERLNEAASW
jgi:hypothetical protein